MVSADARRAGFNGVALGRSQVYGVCADAVCVQSVRHRCPSSWCDCGFYCFHERAAARALACDPDHPHSVVLDVLASGRFIRYELGLRYSRQTVRAVRVGRCGCGRRACGFTSTSTGVVGWRRLVPTCPACAGTRPTMDFATFGRLLGADDADGEAGPLEVRADEVVDDGVDAAFTTVPAPRETLDESAQVSLLTAEVALLQARLDDLQGRLDRLTGGRP